MDNYFEQADVLLSSLPRDSYPHYTDRQYRRKLRNAKRRECALRPVPYQCEATLVLQQDMLTAVLASASLTNRQVDVLRAKADGQGWADIGRQMGHTRQASQKIFKRAITKLRRAWRRYPLAGIDEVYLEETRRCLPRRR